MTIPSKDPLIGEAKLRVSEHYASVQAEGPHTGIPTQFFRFAGCNMRCPLWPCDTQHAIQPNLIRESSEWMTPQEAYTQIKEMAAATGARNICFTGGEPFMQRTQAFSELLGFLINNHDNNPFTLEVFTNGSFRFDLVAGWRAMSYMMDWKLSGSGEKDTKLDTRTINYQYLNTYDGVKFVVSSMAELDEAKAVYEMLLHQYGEARCQFWVGAAWDKIEPWRIVQYIMDNQLPWRLNVQVHKYIWEPEERGV